MVPSRISEFNSLDYTRDDERKRTERQVCWRSGKRGIRVELFRFVLAKCEGRAQEWPLVADRGISFYMLQSVCESLVNIIFQLHLIVSIRTQIGQLAQAATHSKSCVGISNGRLTVDDITPYSPVSMPQTYIISTHLIFSITIPSQPLVDDTRILALVWKLRYLGWRGASDR
jgi:hypothetical protein